MYVNVKAGQPQLRVSRRMTASVEAHWQHRAKNTISDSAAGAVNTWRLRAVPGRVLHGPCQPRVADVLGLQDIVGVHLALVVDDAERADDHFAGREAGQRRHADLPVPAQRPHHRLDRLAHPAQHALPLPFAVDRVGLVLLGFDAASSGVGVVSCCSSSNSLL